MADKTNYNKYSSCNTNFPKGGESKNKYSSKNVVGQVGSAPRRAQQYTPENVINQSK